MTDVSALLQERPLDTVGQPTGHDDWRIGVQILLPLEQALWDVSTWDNGEWTNPSWHDLTPYVRGYTWFRGADEYAGRPRNGAATITLDNSDYQFSPIDPTQSYEAVVNSAASGGAIINDYFGPGTLMRIVAHSPSTAGSAGWCPQITGVVESWNETREHLDKESYVTVTFVETLSRLARVNENAGSTVGNDDTCTERIERLADAAEWGFGYMHGTGTWDTYGLVSTDMSLNRLQELYLTVDSVGAVARSDRSGALISYETAPTRWAASAGPGFYAINNAAANASTSTFIDPDGLTWANDDEPIVNVAQLARVGSTSQEATSALSIDKYGRISYARNDLINKSDALTLALAQQYVDDRAFTSLRLTSVNLNSLADNRAVYPLVNVDVGNEVETVQQATDFGELSVTAQVDRMEHYVTPTSAGGPVLWTATYALGKQTTPIYTPIGIDALQMVIGAPIMGVDYTALEDAN